MVEKIKDRSGDEWHVLDAYFTQEGAIEPASVDGVPVLVPGKLGDLIVVQVPASVSPDDLERFSKVLTEVMGKEPLVVTTNVQFFKFRRVSHVEARSLMRKSREEFEKGMNAVRAKMEAADGASDGNGSVPDGERVGDGGAGDALGAGDDRVDEAAQPGPVAAEEG